MKIEWKKPTWYSMLLAIIIYVGTFSVAFYLGEKKGELNAIIKQAAEISKQDSQKNIINSATFFCENNKNIQAVFFKDKVELTLSDKRNLVLMQAISASGARYTNGDESVVFWNKGDTAFIQEGDTTTFVNCLTTE